MNPSTALASLESVATAEAAGKGAYASFCAAQAAIADGNARNLSDRTMAKRWKAYFAAEDALRAQNGKGPWS